MLKKSAIIRRPLFGFSGLSGLSDFWLNETNQMNQINQINKRNQMDQIDQTTRQTGLVSDVPATKFLACQSHCCPTYQPKPAAGAAWAPPPVGAGTADGATP
jgi:hypothetical protein